MPNAPSSKVIAFRADASLVIGSGHVMRCLTLAQALSAQGAKCHFVCRRHEGNMIEAIKAAGFETHVLSAPVTITPREDDYNSWAGVPWNGDAAETLAILTEIAPDWLVLDHYGFGRDWSTQACPPQTKRLVIDDLANRAHVADVLIDANFGRDAADYAELVPHSCQIRTGPDYSLLRPEFAALRAESLQRRDGANLKHVLVAMGGIDLPDATSKVLRVLEKSNVAACINATVVMGRNAPALSHVQDLAQSMPFEADVRIDVRDMHLHMAHADFAIGAVGGTTWERAALGLPTAMVTIAANQRPAAEALGRAGAALWLGDVTDVAWQDNLQGALDEMAEPQHLRELARNTAAICDGDGTGRVVAMMMDGDLAHRPATIADARRIWDWRHAGDAHLFNKNPVVIPYKDHYAWFSRALQSGDVTFWIITQGGHPVGYLRLDTLCKDRSAVSLCLSALDRGRGLGRYVLETARGLAEANGAQKLVAEVKSTNEKSLRLFNRIGYHSVGQDGDFIQLELSLEQ